MTDQVICAISEVFDRWVSYQKHRAIPIVYSELENRPSPCCCGSADLVLWKPVLREHPVDIKNVSTALECDFHPDIHAYYGSAFSGEMLFSFKGLTVSLVQPWNDDDFERLQQNLIAHVLMLKKLKLPMTLFLATVRDEQKVVSLDNATGQVILEHLGKSERWVLAETLTDFLGRLSPLAFNSSPAY